MATMTAAAWLVTSGSGDSEPGIESDSETGQVADPGHRPDRSAPTDRKDVRVQRVVVPAPAGDETGATARLADSEPSAGQHAQADSPPVVDPAASTTAETPASVEASNPSTAPVAESGVGSSEGSVKSLAVDGRPSSAAKGDRAGWSSKGGWDKARSHGWWDRIKHRRKPIGKKPYMRKPAENPVTTARPVVAVNPATTAKTEESTTSAPATAANPAANTTAKPANTTVKPTTTNATSERQTTAPAQTTATTARSTTTSPVTSPTIAAPQPAPSGNVLFTEDFSGAGSYGRFEHGIYHRGDENKLKTWLGDHSIMGGNDLCGPPEEKRVIHSGEPASGFNSEWIYRCVPGGDPAKAHLMTSIGDTAGYSIGSFTPRQTFNNVREVRWDVNITDLGGRQWTEVHLIPAGSFDFQNIPCIDWLPCNTTTHQKLGAVGATFFNHEMAINNGSGSQKLTESWGGPFLNPGDPAVDSIKTRRSMIFRDNGNGTLSYSIQKEDGSFKTVTTSGRFPSGPIRVVFADHNYTPDKDITPISHTWHWDNISVAG